MIIFIPLGGIGQRFKDNNYTLPKGLVNVFGKPILYYLLDNLNVPSGCKIFVVYNKEYANYRIEDLLRKQYPCYHFYFYMLDIATRGAAETINIGLKQLHTIDEPILCLDSDNFYTCDIVDKWNKENKVFTFHDGSDKPIYSYVIEKDGIVLDIVEKQKISNMACTGAYGFSSCKDLLRYTQYVLDNNITQKNEFYTSTVIKEMIKAKCDFKNKLIDSKYWNCLGTPIQVKTFCNNYPVISSIDNKMKIQPKRICFDFDNTLVTYPKVKNDYTSVEPITKNIEYLRYLKNLGNTIIIYTARRMKTHSGNVGKILSDVGKITFNTLEEFNIPYDEIYFGKPYADFYIDDLAVNCNDDIEKIMGYYQDTIKPRDFNDIRACTMNLYTKSSSNLSGEIYYYNNIPRVLKDMFPILIDYDDNNTWYTMEKIEGINVSSLYTSQLLTPNLLDNIMNSIGRIHNTAYNNDNKVELNIYENYTTKMQRRYKSYNYGRFEKSNDVYCSIYNKLEEYEKANKGECTVIHGDPVFTNIIINKHDKIKFIDMRGKVGDTLTIYGDSLYDWAKLYQSLIGYDCIVMNKDIDESYKQSLLNCFETKFIDMYSQEKYEYLKWITKSLFFTLIPLHDDEKCIKYYNLIHVI